MNPTHNPFLPLEAGRAQILEPTESFTEAAHLWSQREIDALIFAYAARRPLLVRGEAGSGKSQIARAAAYALGSAFQLATRRVPLFTEVIHPRFEALDLLYKFDQVERLSDSQTGGIDRTNRKYVKHGPLWQAIDHMNEDGVMPVLLIDEIDKADAEVPNALLEILGNRSFKVPPLDDASIRAADGRLPMIIITTNEERELPPAFVRRCAVLNLNPPEGEDRFKRWLVRRGRAHAYLQIVRDNPLADSSGEPALGILDQVADQVWRDRRDAIDAGYPKVGLAEYVDLLTALDDLTRGIAGSASRASQQRVWLETLSPYALVKNASQSQDRGRDSPDE